MNLCRQPTTFAFDVTNNILVFHFSMSKIKFTFRPVSDIGQGNEAFIYCSLKNNEKRWTLLKMLSIEKDNQFTINSSNRDTY